MQGVFLDWGAASQRGTRGISHCGSSSALLPVGETLNYPISAEAEQNYPAGRDHFKGGKITVNHSEKQRTSYSIGGQYESTEILQGIYHRS